MSYNWSIAGYLKEPICKISINQLLGEVEIITKMTKYQNFVPQLTSFTYNFLGGTYRIATHQLETPNKNFLGVSVYDGSSLICLSQDEYTFLEPDYRGKGLGAEILAELYTAFPNIMLRRVNKSANRKYTLGGLKSVKKAYQLMIERGAILGA